MTPGVVERALGRLASAGSGGRVLRVPPDRRQGPQPGPGAESDPRVTVVVPCYNYGHFLPRCVETVLQQPGVDPDVLIVEDASPDGSGLVADRLAGESDRVRVIHHSRNQGHIATYNDGLEQATGDYVALLSADDLLTPGCLSRATALMEAHPSVGFVYGHPLRFADTMPASSRTVATHWTVWSGPDWIAARFRQGRNCILSPEVVMRTSVQHRIGGYDPALPHTGDLEMWVRAAAVADVGFVGGADQALYREHSANMHRIEFDADQLSGMAIDLQQRARTFELIARTTLRDQPDAERMLTAARRAIAVEALTLSLRPFYWGTAERWPVDELAALALEVYPDARRLALWTALRLHRRIGPGRPRRDPVSISHELSLRARLSGRDWRWNRVGV